MGYPPVVVVESGGVPRTQVAEGVSAPAFTVVESGARPITLADNAPPIALFNEDGTPYTGGGVSTDPDAEALFAVWDGLGQPADEARQATVTATIQAIKAAVGWSHVRMLQVYRAHGNLAALVDWKTLVSAELIGAPAFTIDRGYAGNGTDAKVNTKYNGGADALPQNGSTILAWCLTSGQQNNDAFGYRQASTGGASIIVPRSTTNLFIGRCNATGSTTNANTDGAGLFAVTRNAASGAGSTKTYKNGVLQVTQGSAASTVIPSTEWHACGSGGNAAAASNWSATEMAIVCVLDIVATDQQHADLYAALS